MQADEFTADQLAAGKALFARPWRFVRGVPNLEHLPAAGPLEVAFAGRSNVGKSSLINALVGQSGLARTSNTPGRTQELNFFEAAGLEMVLVDMPGYGFAKAPKEKVEAWTRTVQDYLRGRPTLARVFLLIDARHGPKPPDRAIMDLLDEAAVSYQAVLTKADKLNPAALDQAFAATASELATRPAAYPMVHVTSSSRSTGIAELRAAIALLAVERGVLHQSRAALE